jgi:ADP-ribosylglycohydrolase
MDREERFSGCLVGLAVGDALGTALEFHPPGTFTPLNDLTGGGPFRLEAGQWTDDTSMALCLGESLVKKQGFDALDQMERYRRWYREGYLSSTGRCFDIGGAVRQALERFELTGEPYSGSTNPYSAGNGSIMRLAPVAMFYASQPEEAIRRCGESSQTTHGAREAVDACRYFGGLLVGALNGAGKEELLSERYSPAPGSWDEEPLAPEIDRVASGSFKQKYPPEIRGSGYVVASLEAALWAFYLGQDFREGCLLAVNLGEDADTTGAVFGQLAGAYYGEAGIPAGWREKLALREQIEGLAIKLMN